MQKPKAVVCDVIEALQRHGFSAFLVGGSVRDRLLNRPLHDIDIATDARPEQVEEVFKNRKVIPTGIAHGTVTLLFEKTAVEITTFRTESTYSDNRHPDSVSFTSSIEEDLARRDFTMNAIACDENGVLTDPFGGEKDISLGLIRAVGDAEERFREDSLRILRALRFSAELGFEIEPLTARAAVECSPLLKNLSPERVSAELSRLLCAREAGKVLRAFPSVLAEAMPLLRPMRGFEQHNEHHCFDVYEHTVVAVENVRPVLHMRLAALFHDCAKPLTFSLDENKTGHFYSHAPRGAALAEDELRRLRFDGETIQKVTKLVKIHDSPIDCDEVAVKKKLRRLGSETFFDLVELQRADNLAQNENFRFRQEKFNELEKIAEQVLSQNECFSRSSLAVNGNDMLSLGLRGTQIGFVLEKLVDSVIEEKLLNERGALLEFALDIAREKGYNLLS